MFLLPLIDSFSFKFNCNCVTSNIAIAVHDKIGLFEREKMAYILVIESKNNLHLKAKILRSSMLTMFFYGSTLVLKC